MNDTATPRPTRWVDPRTLVTRANVRAIAEPDAELVDSIRVHGILQPPVVYPDGDDLVLLAGHRRTAAAIAAGLERIEVVLGPPMDDALRIAAQVSENTNRTGLRVHEVAAAVQQMTLLGVPSGQIAKAAGLRAAQVESARAVAEAGETVQRALIAVPDLTLEQAATVTEWGEDGDAVTDLLAAAQTGPVAFAHAQARLESDRETQQQLAEAAVEWTERGYAVLRPDRSGQHDLPHGTAYVRDLAGAEGIRFGAGYYGVAESHAACPDRAVLLNKWRPESVQEVCLDPKANNHTKTPTGYAAPAPSGPDRSVVIENNKLWKAATGVRLAHLAATIRAGKFSAEFTNDLHLHLLNHPNHLEAPRGAVFGDLTAHTSSGVTTTEDQYGAIRRSIDPQAPAHRITGALIAAVADSAEKSLAASTWRTPNTGAVDWLRLLVTHTGYQLSDIETAAVRVVEPTWAPPNRHATSPSSGPAATAAATRPTTRRTRGASR
jgi:ParB/RepB/Spo0J family partition protein